jgi:hypothetical protein
LRANPKRTRWSERDEIDGYPYRRLNSNGKVQKHSDGGGLFLYVTPGGKKSWRMAYRFAGKQKLLVIGPYPTVGLREARDEREGAKKQLYRFLREGKRPGMEPVVALPTGFLSPPLTC